MNDFDPKTIEKLDIDSWERWVAYRKAIKKPLKALHAAALKLSRYGSDQAAVVDQSISNSWQGLFDVKKQREPGERPQKTDKQKAADYEQFKRQEEYCAKGWEETLREPDPIAKLRLCDALLARYMVNYDISQHEDRMEWLREVVAMHLRSADVERVAGDPHIMSMVRQLFGQRGFQRIQDRRAH